MEIELSWEYKDLASTAGPNLQHSSDPRQTPSLSHSLVAGKMRGLD